MLNDSAFLAITFDILLAKAINGERCPDNSELRAALVARRGDILGSIPNNPVTALVRTGTIASLIYPHNWRVVVICTGEYKNKSTLLPPQRKWQSYKTFGEVPPEFIENNKPGEEAAPTLLSLSQLICDSISVSWKNLSPQRKAWWVEQLAAHEFSATKIGMLMGVKRGSICSCAYLNGIKLRGKN